MKLAKTVKCRITSHSDIFVPTLNIYRDALGFIIQVVNNEWEDISNLSFANDKCSFVEKLIHETKENQNPKYKSFDSLFYKFPSYFRRGAINEAVGIVSSYRSNLSNYQEKKAQLQAEGKILKDKPPALSTKHYSFPAFYKGNMFQKLSSSEVMIKVFKDNDWQWIAITFDSKNLKKRDLETYKECNPTLIKSGNKFYLHIPFEGNFKFKEKKLKDKIAIAVDLGLTNSAVCSAMKSDGTVIDRLFINQPIEKDQMLHRLGRLKKTQKHSCVNSKNKLPNYWRKINNLQLQIVNDTVNKIMKLAIKHDADVVVFEHLSKFKMPKGTYGYAQRHKEKLQFWAKMKIQNKVEEIAHREGIRISRVSPKNTSALAFDGSGIVIRNPKKDLCIFSTGKQYHSDLNASYNIGARYFIREIIKTLSEKRESDVLAKVPELQARTERTLASLISLNKAL
ncbi:MAG: transposase, OrfB family [Anaerosolibacter sp.]|jgi:IS605 OrfB family transposase|uniref:transposase n=1 Tax=Anaerosolibacter sp. TaxID=1872527 RepID=UPI002616747E|nr:transposase [Anaerosolibacter sp.]MDF2545399.1 transposase, OrfB family [Anaerosolibacter sp.]